MFKNVYIFLNNKQITEIVQMFYIYTLKNLIEIA